jgi:nitronate monooxygenase
MTPADLRRGLRLPVVVAPMFLVSDPALVIASCKAGLVGSFPVNNCRTSDELQDWFLRIEEGLDEARRLQPSSIVGPYAVNIVMRSAGGEQYEAGLDAIRKFMPPIVITSVGSPGPVVDLVHAYGGLVFHDVATVRHAHKAAACGVDGMIVLGAGAGGHTGSANPFALTPQIRKFWDGAILLAGSIGDGRAIFAAEVLGADFAYMGTRFIATREAAAPDEYKQLLVSQATTDIVTTDRVSGLAATFMRGSIQAHGLDPDALPPIKAAFQPDLPGDLKAWRDIWSAGHGVGLIEDVPTLAELVDRLEAQYEDAVTRPWAGRRSRAG